MLALQNQRVPKANLWIINYVRKKADNEPAVSLPVYFKSDKKWKFIFGKKKDRKKKRPAARSEASSCFSFHASGWKTVAQIKALNSA